MEVALLSIAMVILQQHLYLLVLLSLALMVIQGMEVALLSMAIVISQQHPYLLVLVPLVLMVIQEMEEISV